MVYYHSSGKYPFCSSYISFLLWHKLKMTRDKMNLSWSIRPHYKSRIDVIGVELIIEQVLYWFHLPQHKLSYLPYYLIQNSKKHQWH